MGKKGLCDTCGNDKGCVFQVKFPVIQCEEFTAASHRVAQAVHAKPKKRACLEEATAEE